MQQVLKVVEQWLDGVVIGLNLCPFAAAPRRREQIHFRVFEAGDDEAILTALAEEMVRLDEQPEIETTLVILPNHLLDFEDYNQFLDWVDALIVNQGWEGVYQVASFHPDYCFADAHPEDVENWTNRSPFPIFHLIREASLEAMLNRFPDAEQIPETNMETLRQLSQAQRRLLFPHCFRAEV